MGIRILLGQAYKNSYYESRLGYKYGLDIESTFLSDPTALWKFMNTHIFPKKVSKNYNVPQLCTLFTILLKYCLKFFLNKVYVQIE
jgi:hypothetical protein